MISTDNQDRRMDNYIHNDLVWAQVVVRCLKLHPNDSILIDTGYHPNFATSSENCGEIPGVGCNHNFVQDCSGSSYLNSIRR